MIENAGKGESDKESDKEKEKEKEKERQDGARDGAQAGAGAPPEAESRRSPSRKSKPKSKASAVRPRGETELDPDMNRLVRVVGRNKVVPDTTAIERHYSRSLKFRHRILEFLLMNGNTAWVDPGELYAQAANYAGCASQTAARWVHQFTRQDAPFKLIEAMDRWVLEKRE